MREDFHRHLDGELPRDELGPEARDDARAWDRLLAAFRQEPSPSSAPPWLESRIMTEIQDLPEPGVWKRAASWLVSPRPLRVSPLTAGLAVAGLAAIFFLGLRNLAPGASLPGTPASSSGSVMTAGTGDRGADPVVYVQFVLEAPGARSVAVAGDFDEWEGSHTLQDLDGDGVWTGRVPIRPGVHAYMFLVDDTTWMTDPRAERYAEDGFGNRNAILAVTTPST